MKVRQNIIIFVLFIKLILVLNSNIFDHINTWTSELLYEYLIWDSLNLNYMVIDPEGYLDSSDISLIEGKMRILFNKFNIRTFIILISHIQRKSNNDIDINTEIQKFVSYFNYMIKMENPHYNDSMSLTTAFIIKERKMRMRTGSLIKRIITDKIVEDILNARKDKFKKENYFNSINDLVDDIYNTYEKNIILHNPIWYKQYYKIILTIILTIILLNIGAFFIYLYLIYVPKRGYKKKGFLRKNRDKQIHRLFNESCTICLNKFKEDNNSNIIKEMLQNEEGKTSILDCGHKFHEKCIFEWLKINNKCPVCRNDVDFDNSTDLYQLIY